MVMIQHRSIRNNRYCNIYRLFLLSIGGILLLVFRQRTANKIIPKDTHTSHQHNTMENDMKEDVILPTVSYSLSAIVRTKKEGNNTTTKLEYALVHDKVDAAARKRAEEKAARKEQQYTLVHEKPPRFVLFCHMNLCVFSFDFSLPLFTTSCTNTSFYRLSFFFINYETRISQEVGGYLVAVSNIVI